MKSKYMILSVCGLLALMLCGCVKKEELVIDTREPDRMELTAGGDEASGDSREPDSGETEAEAVPAPADMAGMDGGTQPEFIYVHICGGVSRPGVYRMEAGSRIFQAVEAAGGFAAGANEGYVNQSRELEDGMKIWIPSVSEMPDTQANMSGDDNAGIELTGRTSGREDGLVNLNTASLEELCTLPGIGASRAQLIVDYREQSGGFTKIEDIMRVEGIKEGSFAKLKDRISVR